DEPVLPRAQAVFHVVPLEEDRHRQPDESAVSRPQGEADLSSLTGTRLGLAVVGHLARKHDLTVSYRPSAIGGTAVVVVVPRELTTRLDRRSDTLSRLTPVTTGEHPVYVGHSPHPDPLAAETDTTTKGSGQPPAASSDTRMTEVAARMRAAETPTAAEPGAVTGPAGADIRAGRTDAEMQWASGGADRTAGHAATPASESASPEGAGENDSRAVTSGGLPKRRRGTTLAAVHPDGLAVLRQETPFGPAAPPPAPRPPSSPSSMAAFQRAVTGRGEASPASLTNLGAAPPASAPAALSRWLTSPEEQPGPDGPASLNSPVLDALRRSDRRRETRNGTVPFGRAPHPTTPGGPSDHAADVIAAHAAGDAVPQVDLPRERTLGPQRDAPLAPPPFPTRTGHDDGGATTLIPSSLTDPLRRETTGPATPSIGTPSPDPAGVPSTGPTGGSLVAPADGEFRHQYDTGSFPAPPTSWETDR
ncbi:ATP-binding protein, partial [Nocardia sp. NPDC004722]